MKLNVFKYYLIEQTAFELKADILKAVDVLSNIENEDYKIDPSVVTDFKNFIQKYYDNFPTFILTQIRAIIKLSKMLLARQEPDFELANFVHSIISYINDYRELANNKQKLQSVKKIKDMEEQF